MKRRWSILLAVGVLGGLVVATVAWAGFPNLLRFQEPVLVDCFPNHDGQTKTSHRQEGSSDPGTREVADPLVLVDGIGVGARKD